MQGTQNIQKISSYNKSGEKSRARLLDRSKNSARRAGRSFKSRLREGAFA